MRPNIALYSVDTVFPDCSSWNKYGMMAVRAQPGNNEWHMSRNLAQEYGDPDGSTLSLRVLVHHQKSDLKVD